MGYFATTQCPLSGFHHEYDINCLANMPYMVPTILPYWGEGKGACTLHKHINFKMCNANNLKIGYKRCKCCFLYFPLARWSNLVLNFFLKLVFFSLWWASFWLIHWPQVLSVVYTVMVWLNIVKSFAFASHGHCVAKYWRKCIPSSKYLA